MRTAAALIAAAAALAAGSLGAAAAHPHQAAEPDHWHAGVEPVGPGIGVERSVLPFEAPPGNALPWAFVEGTVSDPVPGYPVIIQIFDSAGNPAHFAQADVAGDGSYEHRFRVMGVDGGHVVRAFEGAYEVVVFKTVYLPGAAAA